MNDSGYGNKKTPFEKMKGVLPITKRKITYP